jgi:signal transduction histidine kinase
VERAQDLAVEQERNRIARDIHDTVSQSLFGIVFSLDACIQMGPEKPMDVKNELMSIKNLASQTRDQIRHSIFDLWPSSLTMDVFQTDLNHFVKACFSLDPFRIEYDIEGIFENLSPALRRNLYRVTQEALSNVVHHAGVNSAQVCLEIDKGWVYLKIADQGRGFDPEVALSRERNRERFGLHGMRERIQSMGGRFEIKSAPGQGTHVSIQVPVEA